MTVYLSKLQIQNFQSIKSLDLSFDKSPTVLVGETNVGKSAVIRAIRTALSIPRGSSFITDEALFCNITIQLIADDGPYTLIYDKKRGGGTRLSLTTPKTKHDWQAVTSLPDEVRALGLSGLVLDEATSVQVNIASQLDDVFLLRSSQAVTAAKVLARISTVDRIHQGLKAVSTDTTRAKTEQTSSLKSLAAAELQNAKFDKIPSLLESLQSIATIRASAEQLSTILDRMSADRLKDAARIWTSIENLKVSESKLTLLSAFDQYKLVAAKAALMKSNIARMSSFQQAKEQLTLIPQPPSLSAVSASIETLRSAQSAKTKMAALMQEVYMHLGLQIDSTIKNLDEKKREMATKFPACPTCHRPWDHTHV